MAFPSSGYYLKDAPPSAEDALLNALGFNLLQASVGRDATTKGFLVLIYAQQEPPALTEWEGKPITYCIGMEKAKAY